MLEITVCLPPMLEKVHLELFTQCDLAIPNNLNNLATELHSVFMHMLKDKIKSKTLKEYTAALIWLEAGRYNSVTLT